MLQPEIRKSILKLPIKNQIPEKQEQLFWTTPHKHSPNQGAPGTANIPLLKLQVTASVWFMDPKVQKKLTHPADINQVQPKDDLLPFQDNRNLALLLFCCQPQKLLLTEIAEQSCPT